MKVKKILVDDRDSGMRLTRWLATYMGNASFSVIARLIRTGQVRVDSKRSDITRRLKGGEEVRFPDFAQYESNPEQKRNFSKREHQLADDLIKGVLYKDENVIVLNKPPGLAVQGGSNITVSVDSLAPLLQFDLDEKPRLVHRLDKETSGVLLLARNRYAAKALSEALTKRAVTKKYLAILCNVPQKLSGRIDIPLVQGAQSDDFDDTIEMEDQKEAITEYKVLKYSENPSQSFSFVEMTLITGRKHQIRSHSASIGCPVLGDSKYGSTSSKNPKIGEKHLFLHAAFVKFDVFGKSIQVKAELPDYFSSKLKYLGLYHVVASCMMKK